MKLRYALLATALLSMTALADQPAKRLSGSVNAGYNTLYSGRGIVASHAVAEGDSTEFAAVKYNYDFGKKDAWSFDGMMAYTICSSGHTLYGNPPVGPNHYAAMGVASGQLPAAFNAYAAGMGLPMTWDSAPQTVRDQFISGAYDKTVKEGGARIKKANVENEFVVRTALKFKQEKWNVAFGHNFVHGGILGVMAKHYRDQGASCVNEFFISPEITPYKWLSAGVTASFSCQGITGWWFEPHITAKAPIIGTPENPKLVGVVELGMSATADYFESRYFACANGSQAWWVKLSTPYFVTDKFILTPSVSFNWLGKGALKANEMSEFRAYSENGKNVPFRNFAVVGSITATYLF